MRNRSGIIHVSIRDWFEGLLLTAVLIKWLLDLHQSGYLINLREEPSFGSTSPDLVAASSV